MSKDDKIRQWVTVKLRLHDRHAADLNRQARAVNYVWNYANETSGFAWKRDRRWLSAFNLQKLTAGSSKGLDLNSQTILRVCAEYAKVRDKAKRPMIRWRARKSLGWVPFRAESITFDGEAIKFRGIRYKPMHLSPRLVGGMTFGGGSFNRDSRGRWYINLSVAVECTNGSQSTTVGIDLGLKDLATLSDGGKVEAPRFYRKSEAAIGAAQRARKTKRARTIHAKVANRRKDFLHKASKRIASQYGTIIVGDVASSKLARTSMAKSVLDAGWSDFKLMLSYKAIMHGGRYVEVSERMSTQTCSECGCLPPSRPKGIAGLGIREWECDDCGTVHDRDVNAARNILRVGLDTLVEGAGIWPEQPRRTPMEVHLLTPESDNG